MTDQGRGDTALGSAVLAALGGVLDPEIRRPITELDMVKGVDVGSGGVIRVDLQLTIVGCPASERIAYDVRTAAASVAGVREVSVALSVMSPSQRAALTERLRAGRPRGVQFTPDSLTRVIAVTSGKGGVGKSTVTVNLAAALARRGLRVGLVDVDVHGFSVPRLMGLVDEQGAAPRPTRVNDMILPPVAYDVKTISIGMFVDDVTTAVSWRGPMLHRTVTQFLTDVWFGDLDVLLLDLPPGTGDIAITMGQLLPHAEVIVVTTPQTASVDVAERSGILAKQIGQRVIGVVENMAGLAQPDGSVLHLFGEGGGGETARRLSLGLDTAVPLLASLPISVPLRAGGDKGVPVVIGAPEDPAARALTALADRVALMGRGLSGRSLTIRPNG